MLMLGSRRARLSIVRVAGRFGTAPFRHSNAIRGSAAGVVALVLVPTLLLAVPAGAQRPHIPLPAPEPFVLSGFCEGFDVVVAYTTANQYVIRQTTSMDGTITQKITGHAEATVTNATTGHFVTYNISGPGTVVIYPDNAFSINAAGPNLLWTLPANLANFPEVPAISYTTGHVTVEVDAGGQTTSYTLSGGARQTDVCALLAN